MNRRTRRMNFILSVLPALLCAFVVSTLIPVSAHAAAEKAIKKDDARKLIAALSIFELNKEAVTIREISPPGAVATVLASVKLGFRFVKDEAGVWRVADVRTGDRQWESFELLARALGDENISQVRAELDALAAELDALAGKSKGKAATDAPTAESRSANDAQEQASKELKR
ncbi:MAG TPA: hypothetical protein VGB76_08875, partial [Pyrinomonadaceae bacterium]